MHVENVKSNSRLCGLGVKLHNVWLFYQVAIECAGCQYDAICGAKVRGHDFTPAQNVKHELAAVCVWCGAAVDKAKIDLGVCQLLRNLQCTLHFLVRRLYLDACVEAMIKATSNQAHTRVHQYRACQTVRK